MLASRVLALLLLPVVVALDSLVAIWNGWRPGSSTMWGVIGLSLVAIASVLVAPLFPGGRKWLVRWSTPLALSLFSALLALAGGEVFMRTLPQQFHTRLPGLRIECEPEPGLLPGIEGRTRLSVNSRGMRGPDPEESGDVYRMLCVGGSTTECYYLDDSDIWPQLVMDAIGSDRLWVNSAGISGYGLMHHLRFLKENDIVEHLDAVVLLVGINDLQGGMRKRRKFSRPFWSQLRAVQVLGHAIRKETPSMFIEDLHGSNYDLRRRVCKQAPKRDTLWDIEARADDYEGRLREMIAYLRSRDIRPIFLSQPVLWRDDLPQELEDLTWFGPIPGGEYLTISAMRRGMDLFNERLFSVCEDLDVECVDLSELTGVAEFFYDDCHFNVAGSREVARLLTAHLEGGSDGTPVSAFARREEF